MKRLFIPLVILYAFASCKEGGQDEKNDTTGTVITTSTPVTELPPLKIWLDASYSMKGYVDTKEGSEFYGIIGELGTLKKDCDFALYGTSLGKAESYDSFKSKLEDKKIEWGKESNLMSMIKTAVDSSSNELVFIITDGIMSGSDKQISKEKTYNKLHRTQLVAEIKSILEKKEVAINVSQYFLKFKGAYYFYDNSSKTIDEKDRPLYIITIGPKNVVNKVIDETFEKNTALKTDNSITFGNNKMPYNLKISVSNMNCMSREKDNNYRLNTKVLKDIENITFNITGITELPEYMKDENYFKQNGHFQFKKLKTGDESYKDFQEGSDYEIEFSNDKLCLTINKNKINKLSLRYVLDYTNPAWIKNSSTDDDITNYSDHTTFNFEYFTKGLSILNPEGYINNPEKTTINIIN